MLGERLVDRNHREAEDPGLGHRAQPDHSGGGLLGAANHVRRLLRIPLVEQTHEVRPIVHRDLGFGGQHGFEVRVVDVAVFTAPGENRDPLSHQAGRHRVLGGEGVAGAQGHLRPARGQS